MIGREKPLMSWLNRLANNTDLALGILLSVVLGGVVGVTLSHPLGHMIVGSSAGLGVLALYILGYSLGTLWLVGVQKGVLVVSAFVWSVILSSYLGSSAVASSVLGFF